MRKDIGLLWLSISAVGIFIGMLAIRGYVILEPLAFIFAAIVYRGYDLQGSKRKFIAICCVNLLVGACLYWMPHDERGGLTDIGIFLILIVYGPSTIMLAKIYKDELASKRN